MVITTITSRIFKVSFENGINIRLSDWAKHHHETVTAETLWPLYLHSWLEDRAVENLRIQTRHLWLHPVTWWRAANILRTYKDLGIAVYAALELPPKQT